MAFMDDSPYVLGSLSQPTGRYLPAFSVSTLLVKCVCTSWAPTWPFSRLEPATAPVRHGAKHEH